MSDKVFLDASFAIALSSASDQFHGQAVKLAKQMEKSNTKLVTTRAVLLEIGNALSKQRYRQAAVKLLVSIETDPSIEIVPLSEQIYIQALQLYRDRPDKEWGMVDCISFLVMQENDIFEALTTDFHFQQAGFRVMLKEA